MAYRRAMPACVTVSIAIGAIQIWKAAYRRPPPANTSVWSELAIVVVHDPTIAGAAVPSQPVVLPLPPQMGCLREHCLGYL